MPAVLYSFRRCPYAIRARLALRASEIELELREVVLADKPAEMLEASPKGTVPVLIDARGQVLEESHDIMLWALQQNDPMAWIVSDQKIQADTQALIERNDGFFKHYLDRYKYAVGYPEHPAEYYRDQARDFLIQLEQLLEQNSYLLSDRMTLADIAIFPFVRQFAFVDKDWFDATPYAQMQNWLEALLQSELFQSVMKKYPRWVPGADPVLF
jgi:glutathione S-transferase